MDDNRSTRTGHTALSRKSSVATRNSQLIKKNTGPSELRPSDVLIDRFQEWKQITKSLIAYFEGVADIESNTARELTKLGGVIQVPFRAGNQFLGEGGVQDIFYGIRDKTRSIADHHANLAKTVEMSIVQHLQRLRTEIKAHIRNIQLDTGRLAASVAKERETSTKLITDLARSITMLKNTPMNVASKEDPWRVNQLVTHQLQRQVNEENALQKSIIIMQQNSAHFEEGVVRAIQSAWETFDIWSSKMSAQVQETWSSMGVLMKTVQPTTEWEAFAARSEALLDPDTPLRNPDHINYPGKDDPSVKPVHQGLLERKKRFTKSYKEGYYVLAPSGFLHEHRSSDTVKHLEPALSLFLPECTLGPPSSENARKHKFHVELHKGSASGKKSILNRDQAYTFAARSHDEMFEWWNSCKQLSRVYLTSSEVMDRSGPVPAAVRAVGYRSEDEESEEEEVYEDEEYGSSFEEEEEDEVDDVEDDHRHYAHAHHPQQQQQQQQHDTHAHAHPQQQQYQQHVHEPINGQNDQSHHQSPKIESQQQSPPPDGPARISPLPTSAQLSPDGVTTTHEQSLPSVPSKQQQQQQQPAPSYNSQNEAQNWVPDKKQHAQATTSERHLQGLA